MGDIKETLDTAAKIITIVAGAQQLLYYTIKMLTIIKGRHKPKH